MIGYLSGKVIALHAPWVILDVHGVGYEIETPLSTFCQLSLNDDASLWTHLVVREDAQLLYGFQAQDDKSLFRLLLKVNGVGPKLALAVLSTFSPMDLMQVVEQENLTLLTRIPGVGKKTAERLLIELRDRLKTLEPSAGFSRALNESAALLPQLANSPMAEAEAALISLGYRPAEAQKALNALNTPDADTATLIRQALKGMFKS